MQFKKHSLIYVAGIIGLLGAAFALLGADFPAFFRWYLALLGLGIGFYPMMGILFRSFADRGWMLSKTIGLALSGYIVWFMVTMGWLRFTNRRSLVVTLILIGFIWILFMLKQEKTAPDINLILAEEIAFLAIFLMWTYFSGFRPEASGTEKFMDYGFMAAMNRSAELPPKDIWYGLAPINYYYGGQYYGVFLAKLAYVPISRAYNLFRMTIAAFAFVLPFVIVGNMLSDTLRNVKRRKAWSVAGGLIAGCAVSLAGNMHYVIYGLLGKFLKPVGYDSYWFPSSTRYIGHNPDTADKCIHEFPSYSFILGDVHAHMVNIIFVLTVVALLYAWIREVRATVATRRKDARLRAEKARRKPEKYVAIPKWKKVRDFVMDNLWEPRLILAAVFIGIFRWTNYWDYIIYFTVALFCMVFVSLYKYQTSYKRGAASFLIHVLETALISYLIALPFLARFETMVSGIGIAKNHSLFYQLVILWGLPMTTLVLFLIVLFYNYEKVYVKERTKAKSNREVVENRVVAFFQLVPQSDRFAIILGICAFGLILIPELVYVRDIYEDGYARSNTMFKLTYQAYILFGMFLGYAFVRLLTYARHFFVKVLDGILILLFVLTLGYFPYSVKEWFGNVLDYSRYEGLDATAFLEKDYPEDAAVIRWMDRYIEGQPLILEAPGDSYSKYERVSAMTGIPTLEGWYVHEWLWRTDTGDLNEKAADIELIYTSKEESLIRSLVKEYGIEYIIVGSCEREKYTDEESGMKINEDVLLNLGQTVFREGSTYVIHVEE